MGANQSLGEGDDDEMGRRAHAIPSLPTSSSCTAAATTFRGLSLSPRAEAGALNDSASPTWERRRRRVAKSLSPKASSNFQPTPPTPCSKLPSHEDAEFARAVKHSVDAALSLILAGGEGAGWMLGGILKGTGLADSIVDSLVEFLQRRLAKLMGNIKLARLASALAKCAASHLRAEEALIAYLLKENREEREEAPLLHFFQCWQRVGGWWAEDCLPRLDPNKFMDDASFEVAFEVGMEKFLTQRLRPVLNFLMPSDLRELLRDIKTGAPGVLDTAAEIQVGGLGGILSALKEKVILPQAVQALRIKVLDDLSDSNEVCRLILKALEPGSAYDKKGFGEVHAQQAFLAVASQLEQLGTRKPRELRRQLMKELINMHRSENRTEAIDNASPFFGGGDGVGGSLGGLFCDISALEKLGSGLGWIEDEDTKLKSKYKIDCKRVVRQRLESFLRTSAPPMSEDAVRVWSQDRVEGLLSVLDSRANKILLLSLLGVAAEQIALMSRAEYPAAIGRVGSGSGSSKGLSFGAKQWQRRQELFFSADMSYIVRNLGERIMGPDIIKAVDRSLAVLTLERVTLSFIVRDKSIEALRRFVSMAPETLLRHLKTICRGPIEYLTCQMNIQRLLVRYKLDFSKELGPDGEKRLSRQFTRYSWVFCEELLTSLARRRALGSSGDGASWRMQREYAITSINSIGSDELLLLKLQKEWLPELRTSDEAKAAGGNTSPASSSSSDTSTPSIAQSRSQVVSVQK